MVAVVVPHHDLDGFYWIADTGTVPPNVRLAFTLAVLYRNVHHLLMNASSTQSNLIIEYTFLDSPRRPELVLSRGRQVPLKLVDENITATPLNLTRLLANPKRKNEVLVLPRISAPLAWTRVAGSSFHNLR